MRALPDVNVLIAAIACPVSGKPPKSMSIVFAIRLA